MKPTEIIGNCTLYLGDCRDILPLLPKVDLVLTDPPYGIGDALVTGGSGRGFHRMVSSGANEWDVLPEKIVFDLMIEKSGNQIFWGGNYFDLPPTKKPLCWDKVRPNQKNLSEWEMAWTSMVGRAQLFKYCANGGFINPEPNQHPTQKPIALMEWCLDLAPKTTLTVADPFMGSGTTGVACANMGKTFYGIEREPKYFDIACKRIEQAYAQARLFA